MIKNKFVLQTPVAGLAWLATGLIFTTFDGKVKCIQTATNKMFTIINAGDEALCVSLTSNQDQIVTGFSNGVVLMNTVGSTKESTSRQVLTHSCPPTALVLTNTGYLCTGGCDGRLAFQDMSTFSGGGLGTPSESVASSRASNRSGRRSKALDTSNVSVQSCELNENVSCGVASPSGTVIVLAVRDRIVIFELENTMWMQKMVNFVCTKKHFIKSG